MADSFKDREKGEEFRFEIEQEILFKAESRRNRLLGEWLADRFGMTSDQKDEYIRTVIFSDLEEQGIEDIIGKVMKDIEDRSASITEDDVRAELERLYAVALEQVKAGFKSDTL